MIPWLAADRLDFPPVERALKEPNGLLAAGGDLSPNRLLAAYRLGIFPWYEVGQPILWWSPDPRAVLFLDDFHVSRRLARRMRVSNLQFTLDSAFEQVVEACAGPRNGQFGTWITPEMKAAYGTLHRLGHAHSVECWQEGTLIGGVYGLSIGRVFYGESMFSRQRDASKMALDFLVKTLRRWQFTLIDCQQESEHMLAMGAAPIARKKFQAIVLRESIRPGRNGPWRAAASLASRGDEPA